MELKQQYGGAIWTNHALDRLKQRKLPQYMALQAFTSPDATKQGKHGTTEYQKYFDKSLVTVIAKQNEKKEWIILSTWIDPPLPGTDDAKKKENYKKFRKAGFWGKVWWEFKKQLGIAKY